jgi:uncharacterized protein YndB with AHSA1/START domain
MITVESTIECSLEKAWDYWTNPIHIKNWYHATDDWHAPYAENDLRVNGKFRITMAAKDGSAGFDFEGLYTNIIMFHLIEYVLSDGRKVKITFSNEDNKTKVIETFDPETINPLDLQKAGWQAILDQFRIYIEQN